MLWLIFGGFLLGIGIGWLVSHLLRRIDDRLVVITITIAVAYGMYVLGTALSTSGLLAVVGAGLDVAGCGSHRDFARVPTFSRANQCHD